MNTLIVPIAIGVVVFVIIWVWIAATRKVPRLEESDAKLAVPSLDWLKTAYEATVSLYIETDREIYQISTIFLSASLIIMGWVITNLDTLSFPLVVVAGAASILMVGVATVLKFRLRIFNLVHIEYLKRLERAFVEHQEHAEYWGIMNVRTKLKAGANPLKFVYSIHGVMITYFVLFIAIWGAVAIAAYLYFRMPSLPPAP